ncbi:uncharacterized protein LOC119106858 [Pollicipes pollicipes]|uniref:uncharacterized protein LOC119106858 n=1 Tax=Pollicipes pollicipes TaxID=41117 RepID=UPI00188596BD|nr:uncharacterized protein LOC119106858 [Pollicipes pollicipes]
MSASQKRRILDEVKVPALTVCHGNKFKKEAVEKMSLPGVSLLDWLDDDTPAFSLLHWDEYNLDEFFAAANYKWEDMVTKCTIGNVNCSDLGTIRAAHTPLLGACATLRTNTTVGRNMLSGQLNLVLSETGSFADNEYDGWGLFVHEHSVQLDDFALFAGVVTYIKLHANSSITVKLTTNAFSRLPEGNTCSEQPIHVAQSCLERCVFSKAGIDRPSCHVPWISASAKQPPCTTYQQFKSASGLDELSSFNESLMAVITASCGCRLPCRWEEYVSSTPHSVNIDKARAPGGAPRRRPAGRVVTELALWLHTTVMKAEEGVAYPLNQFLSDVGGSLGLMIGGSLLTIVELVDCLVCACCGACSRR